MEPKVKHQGTVVFSKCKCCGHHEVCVMIGTGDYIPLKKGEFIKVYEYDRVQIGEHMKKIHANNKP
jgi:hypothetical protein